MKNVNKKGELSTEQIVLIIILIVSFIIILYFLYQMYSENESEKDICRNSVMMRGTSSISSDALPLKCSRSYICITKNGDCIGMVKPDKRKVKTEEEIYETLAKEMADCWWMLGEGKVDYVGKDKFTKDNYCSICSQILFDKSLDDIDGINGKISKDKLYDYMAKTKMQSQNITYAQYLLGTNDLEKIKSEVAKNQSVSQVSFGEIYLGRNYYLITGITSEVGNGWRFLAGGTIVVGFFAGYSWAGLIAGAIVGGAGIYGSNKQVEIGAITIQGRGVKNEFMSPTIQEANSATFDKLNCYEIISSS